MSTIVKVLQDHAIRQPKQRAYLFLEDGKKETNNISYNDLDNKARVIAAYLQHHQLAGERVLLVYPAGIDFIAAFMGCLYAGVIAVPMTCSKLTDIEKMQSSIHAIAKDADIAGILTIPSYLNDINICIKELSLRRFLFVTASSAISEDSQPYRAPRLTNQTIAYLQYTSGSTSQPKGVIICHGSLTHSLKYTAQVWHFTENSVMLNWAPHSHVYGLICGLLLPLYQGALTVIMPTEAFVRRPLSWLEAMTAYRATHSGCPNFGYDLCIRDIRIEDCQQLNLTHWKVAVNGGENVSDDTLQKFSKKFQPFGFHLKQFNSAYGMSEATGAIAVSAYLKEPSCFTLSTVGLINDEVIDGDDDIPHRQLVSSGKLLPGLSAVVVDPQSLTLADKNQIGEIWLTGKSIANGYWQREEETKDTFKATLAGSSKAYFRTGDLGFIREGEICLTGRLKELMVVNGKKYYPLDFEAIVRSSLSALSASPACMAFSLFENNKEEIIFIQEVEEATSSRMQSEMLALIRQAVMKQFSVHLDRIVLVGLNSILKTASGKLQRKLTQRRFVEGQMLIINDNGKAKIKPETSKVKLTHSTIQLDVIQLIAEVLQLKTTEIDLQAPISSYQMDSINLIKLSSLIKERYQFEITPADLYEYKTLGEFVDIISKKNNGDISSSPISSSNKVPENDIAIIGISGVFPGAPDVETFWQNMLSGKDAISEIPKNRWDWQALANQSSVKWGGFIDGIAEFDADFFHILPREAELTDPQHRVFLQTVWRAIEDAGYSTSSLSNSVTGMFVGVFNHDYAELLQRNGIHDAYVTTGATNSMLANRVSYLLNLHGPSEVIDTACSSSLVAIHHAVRSIQYGDCDIAIAGGVNALLTPSSYLTASKANMLSADGRCKTFDASANGYVRSEGAAAIVLKSFQQAIADGDHIYGIIKGTAVNHGGHANSLTAPNPISQANVIAAACRRANINIESLSYIEAHGTGTALGDPVEINGLKKAFSLLANEQHLPTLPKAYCGIGTVKTHVGHLESAAGITGVIKVLLAMQHETLPGNLHLNEINPYIELDNSPFYITKSTQSWTRLQKDAPRYAGISSFGFGGTNAHIIIADYFEGQPLNASQHHPVLITLSAKTERALHQRLQDLYDWLNKIENQPLLTSLSYTLNVGRDHFQYRCALVVSSLEELQESLKLVLLGHELDNYIVNLGQIKKTKGRLGFEKLFSQINDELASVNQLSLDEQHDKLLIAANFYTEGFTIDWQALYQGKKIHRLALPTYPFEKNIYWLPEVKQPSINLISANIEPMTSSLSLSDQVCQDFIRHVSVLSKIAPEKIQVTSSLSELGFDSISFKELAVQLETQFNIDLTPAVFFTHHTIQELVTYLLENHAAAMADYYQLPKHLPENQQVLEKVKSSTVIDNEPIAIIGINGVFPQSPDLQAFWQHLEAGDDLVSEVPEDRWDWRRYFGDAKQDASKTNSKWGGFIKDVDKFDAGFFNISSREANLMDPQHRLLMEVVWKSIEDAGYDPFSLSNQSVGIFAGIEFSEYQTLIHQQKDQFHGHVATGNSHALLANRISYFLNFHGPSEVIDTACSSSLVAVHRAANAIRHHECDVAIAGGVSLMLNPETFVITSQLGALSADGRCKTFDKSANGYVKGEGAGAIMLKRLSEALAAGDPIYGIIKATAVNHGGKAQSLTAPNATAQSQLLIKAYTEANIDINTLTYIEAHGTGTELGDPVEIEGLKQAFKVLHQQQRHSSSQEMPRCGLGSVKTNIGHLEPASGIAGIIKVLLSMKHKKIPKNLHFSELNPYIDIRDSQFYIVDQLQKWQKLYDKQGLEIPYRAGVSSFGFGGTNAHVVLEEAPSSINAEIGNKPYYLITLSAKQPESLQQKLVDLAKWVQLTPDVNIEALSYTLNKGRAHFKNRCVIIVASISELQLSLKALINQQVPDNCLMTSKLIDGDHSALYQTISQKLKQGVLIEPSTYRALLVDLGHLYLKNFPIEWELIYQNPTMRRLSLLPTYPFIRQRYWFDSELSNIAPVAEKNVAHLSSQVPENSLKQFILHYLQEKFAKKLNCDPQQITFDDTYEVFGVDSLIGLEITNSLEEHVGVLPKTLLYERNNLLDLADYFQKKYSTILQKLYSSSASSTPEYTEIAAPISQQLIKQAVSQTKDIAIVGLSGHFPMAENMDEFWENLVNGRNCITEVPKDRWDYRDYPAMVGGKEKHFKYGGFLTDVDKFDPLFFNVSPRDATLMDPQERLFLQSAWTTLEDAGYTREALAKLANNNVGVFAGATYNFYPLLIAEEWAKGNRLPLDVQMFSIANRLSYFMNISGPSFVVDTACSSALAAIHLACESIIRGECVMAIAGGVNLSLHPTKYHFLGSYSFMSDAGQCASFAEGGSGYVPSEGVGTVLLKPLDLAIQDNDRIYGVIKASCMNHGGKTSGYTVPNPNAQAELIKETLNKANIDPNTISYIEAHGTGTSLGDPIEVRGLQEAFEAYTQNKQFCAIGSVKSNIGHLESAAGISQLAKVLLQLKHKKLVPTIHAEKLNPFIDFAQSPFYVQRELTDWNVPANQPRRAAISSFGAGGANIHMIVEEYQQKNMSTLSMSKQIPYIYLLSALNAERLKEYAQHHYQFLAKNKFSEIELMNICYTSQIGREAMTARLAILANNQDELQEKLKSYLAAPEQLSHHMWLNLSASPSKTFFHSSQYEELLQQWVNGAAIDWKKLYLDQLPQRVAIPTYPFAKRRCWVTNETVKQEEVVLNFPVIENEVNHDDWLYTTDWEKKPALEQVIQQNENGHWLIVGNPELGSLVQNELGAENTIYIDHHAIDDLNTIHVNYQHKLKGIIYIAPEAAELKANDLDLSALNDHSDKSFHLLKFYQTLIGLQWQNKLQICFVTRGAQSVNPDDSIQLWQHHQWSLTRIFGAEQADYRVQLIDLDPQDSLEIAAKQLTSELHHYKPAENHIAYRSNSRHVIRLNRYQTPTQIQTWQAPEAAMVTGGLGALGYEVATFLAQQGTKYLLLTGTSELNEKASYVSALEKIGATVVYAVVDVRNKTKMQNIVELVESRWQRKIKGVFHLAGVTTDSIVIDKMTDSVLQHVLSIKMKGALVLHEIFKKTDLNCFVLFSSIASLPYFGMSGLSAYAMANEFLNGLAYYRRQKGMPAISINWAAWADKGMSFRYDHSKFLDAVGMSTIAISHGIQIMHHLLRTNPTNVTVFKIQWQKFMSLNAETRKLDFFAHFSKEYATKDVSEKPKIIMNRDEISSLLTRTLAKFLELEVTEINADTPYQQYGMDSIIGINFVAALNEHFTDILSPMDLYRYPTLKQLLQYVLESTNTDGHAISSPDKAETSEQDLLSSIAHLSDETINQLLEDELKEIEYDFA